MSSIGLRRLDCRRASVARRAGRDERRTIGALFLDAPPFARASVLSAIQAAARDADYLVSIAHVPVTDDRSVLTAVASLRDLETEGILLVAPHGDATSAVIAIAGEIPLVAIATGPHDHVSTVSVDDYGGAAAATRHLLGLGNRTVFHVSGPLGQHDAARRVAGWRDALLAAGAAVPPPLIGDWSPACGYELGLRLGARADVTAIFVAGDQMALGVLLALHELERRIPEDVSVVGFDCIPQGEFFTPPLSTVRQNFAELGRRSCELLLGEIELGRHPTVHHTIPTELILRASTMTATWGAAPSVVSV
jgi:DNA-binding LacI/PurR family transcriptional regulator